MTKCPPNHSAGPFGAFHRPTIALAGFKQAASYPLLGPASNLPLTQPGEPLDANTSPSRLVPAYSHPGPHLAIASTDSNSHARLCNHMCPAMTCPGQRQRHHPVWQCDPGTDKTGRWAPMDTNAALDLIPDMKACESTPIRCLVPLLLSVSPSCKVRPSQLP
ncbi:hypothetical protein IQ07DRAFT_626406 [Pyrenochaeta sp. DS3sAY3a]|nr:hypothetical protein IQ07DRAFT_626406 [Pyrenochaeta sp. DS3sAY3a]